MHPLVTEFGNIKYSEFSFCLCFSHTPHVELVLSVNILHLPEELSSSVGNNISHFFVWKYLYVILFLKKLIISSIYKNEQKSISEFPWAHHH